MLDCNTGKIWLKDASCMHGTWDGTIPFDATSVQAKVASLNSGTNLNCSDYTAGTYTDWEVPAMTDLCGLWSGSCAGSGCCTLGSGIVDTRHASPAVRNARDDGHWMEDDAFVGVPNFYYWSSTAAFNGTVAWKVSLQNGFIDLVADTDTSYVWPVRVGQ